MEEAIDILQYTLLSDGSSKNIYKHDLPVYVSKVHDINVNYKTIIIVQY